MKKFIYIISVMVISLIAVCFITKSISGNDDETDYIAMRYLPDSLFKDLKVISEDEEINIDMEATEKVEEDKILEVSIEGKADALEVLSGEMSGYGPDCLGCSGYLASGLYVLDGKIYYTDSMYGKVRIVAGDKKYPFGTIVRIKNSILGEFLAIVLDRGGDIGVDRKFMFDLLYSSEELANRNGVSNNVVFEVLRYGY